METQFQLLLLEPLPLFLCMFVSIYLLARFVVFRNWSPETRPEASSCLISLAHGTPAVVLALRALLLSAASGDGLGFASANSAADNLVLDYSVAYFVTDLLHYLVFCPGDVLFIGHHLATLFVFLTCRYAAAHGAAALLSLLVLAEVTSACQNAWTLAAARRRDVAFAARLHRILSPPFYALYSVVRGLAGPYLLYRMAAFYISGAADKVIPRWVWVSWIVVVLMAISVSILWIANLSLTHQGKLSFFGLKMASPHNTRKEVCRWRKGEGRDCKECVPRGEAGVPSS